MKLAEVSVAEAKAVLTDAHALAAPNAPRRKPAKAKRAGKRKR
jgi:hypothetical protein